MKLLPNSKNPPVVLKYHTSEAAIDHVHLGGFLLRLIRDEHWRKSTNDREGRWNRNYDFALRTILITTKNFHISNQAWIKCTDSIILPLTKNIYLVTQSL